MKIVPDTRVVIGGRVTALIDKNGEYKNATIIIPEAVFAELEAQANQGREIGFSGLSELQKLTLLAKEGKIQLQYVGERPKLEQAKLSNGGEIDSMIRSVAIEHQATLLTSNYVQSEIAKAKGIDVIFLKSETSTTFDPLQIDEFFDENTFAVYLKEHVAPYARKGTIKESKLVNIRDVPCTEHELCAISQECLEHAKHHTDGFVDVELPSVTVSQIGSMRITTTKPPFSDSIEITIDRPTREITFEFYNFAPALKDRLKEFGGMLIAGPLGSGKSTLEQNIATHLSSENFIVKTIVSSRNLMVANRITQYTSLDGSFSDAGELLMSLHPDYVIFDEMHRREEFATYTDLRLSGVKVVGGLHARSVTDALIRLTSFVDLNLIPQIVSTMVFVKTGDISEIYNVSSSFSVPKALEQIGDHQIRPVVRLTNIITTEIVVEAFRYEGEVMVTPISDLPEAPNMKTVKPIKTEVVKTVTSAPVINEIKEEGEYVSKEGESYNYDRQAPAVHSMPTYEVPSDNPAWVILEKEIQNEICHFTDGEIIVRMISDMKAAVYIENDDVPAAIGKAGKNIAAVVSKVGVGIDVRPLSDLPERGDLSDDTPVSTLTQDNMGFQIRSERKQISIICPEHTGKIVDLFSGKEYLFTATVDDRGEIHLARNSSVALEIVRRYEAGEDLKICPVD
ncbi:MAG TPA: PINc/VapC family ATPase [Methanocorpusculum sp.]|nr:PINc/VapC family ATPase [Methanocorpusculum sp.]